MLAFTTACGPLAGDETGTAQTKASSSTAAKPAATAIPNGVEKLPTAEILNRARQATGSARFLRVRAQAEEDGERYKIDFRYAGKTKATGWFSQDAQRVEITRIGKVVYLSGNWAFWVSAGGKSAAQEFAGKHVKSTVKNPDFKEIAIFADRSALLTEALKAMHGWEKGEEGKVGTIPTTVLTASTGDRLHVATQGRPYVLLLDGGPGNSIEYLGYEQPVTIKAPPAGSVVDLPN
ncbi:hypothetical protein [Actinomadura sp. 3N508]|uniref:hypothetical protein n=1 Tax=Actinomadura sp. 3N508 TaxID=3375153 RepID=UPI00379209CE